MYTENDVILLELHMNRTNALFENLNNVSHVEFWTTHVLNVFCVFYILWWHIIHTLIHVFHVYATIYVRMHTFQCSCFFLREVQFPHLSFPLRRILKNRNWHGMIHHGIHVILSGRSRFVDRTWLTDLPSCRLVVGFWVFWQVQFNVFRPINSHGLFINEIL